MQKQNINNEIEEIIFKNSDKNIFSNKIKETIKQLIENKKHQLS